MIRERHIPKTQRVRGREECLGCSRPLSARNVCGMCRTCNGRRLMTAPTFPAGKVARMHWTPDMDAALVAGRAKGIGLRKLAPRIGVAINLLTRRSRELGLASLPCSLNANRGEAA